GARWPLSPKLRRRSGVVLGFLDPLHEDRADLSWHDRHFGREGRRPCDSRREGACASQSDGVSACLTGRHAERLQLGLVQERFDAALLLTYLQSGCVSLNLLGFGFLEPAYGGSVL